MFQSYPIHVMGGELVEGFPNMATFLSDFEGLVIELQLLSTLDYVLKATPTR